MGTGIDVDGSSAQNRDVATLSRICREQDAELRLLRARIERLRSSRWRKLGQRLGLVRIQDWEQRDQIPRH